MLVLPVFISGQPYPRDVEARLRTRYAVLAGLNVVGYKPKDPRHIHYFTTLRKRRDPDSEVNKQEDASKHKDPNNQGAPRSYWVVPYEWFDRKESDAGCSGRGWEVGDNTYRPRFDDVLLLWVNEYELHGTPLHGLAKILTELGGQRDEVDVRVRVLGPTSSDVLLKMWQEEKKPHLPELTACEPALDGATFYSPRATVSNDFIRYLPRPESNRLELNILRDSNNFLDLNFLLDPNRVVVGNTDLPDLSSIRGPNDTGLGLGPAEKPEVAVWLSDGNAGIRFEWTIASDEDTCERLVEELALREADPTDPKNHILLIMEWDTHYGRALLETFAAVVRRRVCASKCDPQLTHWSLRYFLRNVRGPEGVKEKLASDGAEIWQLGHIHRYTYLRGIDGRLPGDESPGSGEGPDTSKGEPGGIPHQDLAPIRETTAVRPEGRAQLDYVRRMEARLRRIESEFKKCANEDKLRAIGVLGTDVYDKLLILRSLRPCFPRAIFFTVDLDANLLHPDEKEATRNLVIASPFGLQLCEKLQQDIPPFRDSYQTSTFFATLKALEYPKAKDQKAPRPRIYERGRSGAYDLSYFPDPCEAFPLPRGDRGRRWKWEWPWKAREKAKGDAEGEGKAERGWEWEPTWCWVVVGFSLLVVLILFTNRLRTWLVVTAITLVVMVYIGRRIWGQHFSEDGEPFALFEGISIWPTQLLQLVSVVVSACFVLHMWQRLRENRQEIDEELFRMRAPQGEQGAARTCKQVITAWTGRCRDGLLLVWRVFLAARETLEKELFRRPDPRGESDSREERPQGGPRTCKETITVWMSRCRDEFLPLRRVFLPRREIRKHPGKGKDPGDVGSLWEEYNQCRRTPKRLVRTVAGLVCFHVLWCSLSRLLLEDPAYALSLGRGEWSHQAAWWIGLVSYSVLIVLLLLVLDATVLCDSVIQRLFDPKSKLDWSDEARRHHADHHGLREGDVDEWLGIRLISEHTKSVGKTIYFPFIILFILLAARDQTFDGWSWPVSSVIVLSLILLGLIYAAVILRVSARRARDTALARLAQKLTEARKDDEEGSRTVKLARLHQEIRDERTGAFCPITENPIIHAGSLGTVAVLNQVLVALG